MEAHRVQGRKTWVKRAEVITARLVRDPRGWLSLAWSAMDEQG